MLQSTVGGKKLAKLENGAIFTATFCKAYAFSRYSTAPVHEAKAGGAMPNEA